MPKRDEDYDDDEGGAELDDTAYETEANVKCPYCGETVTIALDPDGGEVQEYVEDCEVCCRPWQVHVSYGLDGAAEVTIEEAS